MIYWVSNIFCQKTAAASATVYSHKLFSQLSFLQTSAVQSQSLLCLGFLADSFPIQHTVLCKQTSLPAVLCSRWNGMGCTILPMRGTSSCSFTSFQTHSSSCVSPDPPAFHQWCICWCLLQPPSQVLFIFQYIKPPLWFLGYLTNILAATSCDESTFAHIIALHLAFIPSVCQSFGFIWFNASFYHTKHF